jgi:hypothetical protein
MRHQMRGWMMPEADMLSMLRMIEEKIQSPEIDMRHRDTLIRLREILENDLVDHRNSTSLVERSEDEDRAA